MNNYYTCEELIYELQRFYIENGRVPTEQNFLHNKEFPSFKTFQKYFGTWNNALMLAGLDINQHQTKLTGEECCYKCGSETTNSHWCFKNNKRVCDKCYSHDRNYLHGMLDPNSKTGRGVITEYIVYKVLEDCKKCNTNDEFHADYDLISKKYGNINVKSSKLLRQNKNSYYWVFSKCKNSKNPKYYICIGFDEDRFEILKVWMIPENSKLIANHGITITNSEKGLPRASQYEVDPTLYNDVYQNLDITILPEFRNINKCVV